MGKLRALRRYIQKRPGRFMSERVDYTRFWDDPDRNYMKASGAQQRGWRDDHPWNPSWGLFHNPESYRDFVIKTLRDMGYEVR